MAAAEKKAIEISQPMNIAVVNTGGGNGTGEEDQAVAEAGIAVFGSI